MALLRTFFLLLLICISLSAEPRRQGSYRPNVQEVNSPAIPDFSALSLYQKGFTSKEKRDSVEGLKNKMLTGEFDYSLADRVSGLYNRSTNTFYVSEGHTRMSAALEIAREKGDWSYFKKLIQSGYWDETDTIPKETYALPMRMNLFNFIGCLRILKDAAMR